jgi:hypothetical protein
VTRSRTCSACQRTQHGELRKCSCGSSCFYSGRNPRRQSIKLAVDSWRPEKPASDDFAGLVPMPAGGLPTFGQPFRHMTYIVGGHRGRRGGAGPQ